MDKNVFIIGSKGIPAKYGGFETFVEELTKHKMDNKIKYHIACLADKNVEDFEYNDSRCFSIKVPEIGPARALFYDLRALRDVIAYIEEYQIKDAVVYVLACRIGPFFKRAVKKLHKLGGKVCVNPDGHEWKRQKWNKAIQQYWKLSERLMVKHADLLICDSKAIEAYIQDDYHIYKPKTLFIPYGANIIEQKNDDTLFFDWASEKSITENNYYLIVGRFVPENNYALIIEEFLSSETTKDLVIVTNVENNQFYQKLAEKTNKDKRIKFVGTVYDQVLLGVIRTKAFAYFHGHEVGGTNPSLLEAMATTKLCLLLDVSFNKEVGQNGALYFTKEKQNLRDLITQVENLSTVEMNHLSITSTRIIREQYNWHSVVEKYEKNGFR